MPGFSIVTNISSLIAQENLNETNELQQRTITRLTSGLRINSSADDAAGLAIANRFRSDIAVLQQGIRNAADGLSTLQTIDGGLNNVSLLIDRARTLATQSASGTFTGDRNALNAEFQSVIEEIDRQAQSIGLDPGGEFNSALSVFIGGGRSNGGVTSITNGSVSVDLSNSSVSSNDLGLQGIQALGASGTDIGSASSTSVENVANDTTNKNSLNTSGFTEFQFVGPGFSDDDQAVLSVNLNGVVDTQTLVTAINDAVSGFSGSGAAAQAFKNAGIEAVINTDSDGKKQLGFKSTDTAFQVRAGDRLSNALLGNFDSGGPTGASLDVSIRGDAETNTSTGSRTIKVAVLGGGLLSPETLTVTTSNGDDQSDVLSALQTALAANTTLVNAGFSVEAGSVANTVQFTNSEGESFEVIVGGDLDNILGFGTGVLGGGDFGTATDLIFTTVNGSGNIDHTDSGTITVSVFINGSDASSGEQVLVTVDAANTSDQEIVDQINAQIALNSTLSNAGLQASLNGSQLVLGTGANGTTFRLTVDDAAGGNNTLGFNDAGAETVITSGTKVEASGFVEPTLNPGGAQATSGATSADPSDFTPLFFAEDKQNIVVSAKDPTGAVQSLNVNLTFANARTLDQAVDTINDALQQSNNSTLQQVVAVKERNGTGTEGIRFLSTLSDGFNVAVGDNNNDNGIANGGGDSLLLSSSQLTGGNVADISSQENAETAVTLLAEAVTKLSLVQADVGKGQNNLQFAIDLATTQQTNLSAAESRIRDADLAAEAANLTRASIAQQAGVAALAQANAAPQAVLALLQG